jgi:16S rRNA U516 pseudouridylate synthase RsuA-like enzyme
MIESIGMNVIRLHRVSFGGIRLKGLSEGFDNSNYNNNNIIITIIIVKGNWAELSEEEIGIIQKSLKVLEKSNSTDDYSFNEE